MYADNYFAWSSSRTLYLNTNSSTGANVANDVVNFPVLVRLTSSNWPAGAKNDGTDIRFSKNDGTHLYYERERWDNTNQLAEFWVLVDTVWGNNSTHNTPNRIGDSTVIKMYWGNSGAADSSKPQMVFDTANGFMGVWHFSPADTFGDATVNNKDATNNGTTPTTSSYIGHGREFVATSNQYLHVGSVGISGNVSRTISGWVLGNTTTDWVTAFGFSPENSNTNYFFDIEGNDDDKYCIHLFNNQPSTTTSTNDNTWHYIAATHDGSTVRIYIDGTQANSGSYTLSTQDLFRMGYRQQMGTYWTGKMDEIRVSKTARSADWIKLCYENQKASQSLIKDGPTVTAENYADWSYNRTIYLNTKPSGANVANNVTKFPVLVRLNGGNFDFSQSQVSGGKDIRFAKADGTHMFYEIERWSDGPGAADTAEIWVLVDTVYGNNSSQWFRMYWGKAGAGDNSNAARVFDTANGFRGVWHLRESGSGVWGDYQDATYCNNDGQGADGTVSKIPTAVSGLIGRAQSFDGNDDYIRVEDSLSLKPAGNLTASAWVYFPSISPASAAMGIMSMHMTADPWASYRMYTNGDSLWAQYSDSTVPYLPSRAKFSRGAWYHTVMRRSTSGSQYLRIFINGEQSVQWDATTSGNLNTANTDYLYIGAYYDVQMNLNGYLDEVRIEAVERDSNWIKLCYENQKPNQTLVWMVAPVDPPSNLSYSEMSPTYYVGRAIIANTPTVTGTVDSFTVSPALPAGLSINKTSGVITGTPTAMQSATNHVVTAANAGGSTTAEITITVVQLGAIVNPLSITAEFMDSVHVRVTVSGYGSLPTSGLENVDSVGIWYSSTDYPTALVWGGAGTKYSLVEMNLAGTSFTDTLTVPLIPQGPTSYYYFVSAPRWHTPQAVSGDSIPPCPDPPTGGARVTMTGALAVTNNLRIDSLRYIPQDTIFVAIGNTPSIDPAKVDSVGIWYGFVRDVNFGGGTGVVKTYTDGQVMTGEPYVVRLQDIQFSGQEKKVYVAVALKGTNGLWSSYKLDSTVVGFPLPVNDITLHAEDVTAYGARLRWSRKDSVRIWWGTTEVPAGVNFETAPFTEHNPTRAESTWTLRTLSPQTTYYFGLQRYANTLWSEVTAGSKVSITTLAAPETLGVEENLVVLESLWQDTVDGRLRVRFRLDTTGGKWQVDYQVNVAYTVKGYDSLRVGLQVVELADPDTSVEIAISGDLLADTVYYVGLFLRRFEKSEWSVLTERARGSVRTSAYRNEGVTYLNSGDSVETAFNGNVILRWTSGFGAGNSDTLQVYDVGVLPVGFVEAGEVGFEFQKKLQGAPFLIGIRCDTAAYGRTVRMYRVTAQGEYVVMHGSWVSGDTVWVVTNDLSLPFMALLDTLRPVVTFGTDTDTAAAIPDNTALGMSFTVSDNVSNVRWELLYGRGHMAYEGKFVDTLDSVSGSAVKVIPAAMVNKSYGLRAILVVCDGGKCDTINISRQVQAPQVDELVVSKGGWVPLRVTGEVSDTTVTSCLSDVMGGAGWQYDTKKWRLFRWYPHGGTAGRWVEYADSVKGLFSFVPGRVIWMKTALSQQGIRLGAGVSTSLKKPCGVVLKARNWSDITVPYKFDIRLSDILGESGAWSESLQVCRWVNTDSGYVALDVYARGLLGKSIPLDTLRYEPLKDAYCVWNPYGDDKVLLVPPNPVGMPALGKGRDMLSKTQSNVSGGWSVVVEGHSGSSELTALQVGEVSGPGDGAVYYPQRPHFGGVSMGVVEPESRRVYGHVMQRVGGGEERSGRSYEIVVSNEGGETRDVWLRLRGNGGMPRGYAIGLYNPVSGAYESASGEGYRVTVGGGANAYRWVVAGTEAYRTDFSRRYAPYRLSLVGAYPNPSGGLVKIRYSLPYKEVGELKFDIYDLQGRRIWSMERRDVFRPGYGEFSWDGVDGAGRKAGAGVYVIRMKAREKGERKQSVFEMRMTRL